MKYRIRHYTEYAYQEPVTTCLNRLCLTPVNLPHHECLSSDINIAPQPDEFNTEKDFFGNQLTFFSIYKQHKKLRINSTSIVKTSRKEYLQDAARSQVTVEDISNAIHNNPGNTHDLVQYILPSHYIPHSQVLKEFAADCFGSGALLWDACNNLMKKIHQNLEFKPGFTTINTPVETVLNTRKGVCQDFAHLMITCIRNWGVPARYVSGYIETLPPPGKEKMVGADASHAWVSVYFPDVGWIEFDPTNKLIPDDQYITVAYGRDYLDVAPIKGIVFSSGKQTLTVKVDVERLDS